MSKIDEIMVLAQEYGIYYSAWDRLPNKGRKSALDEKSQELRNAIEALAQPAGEAEPVYQVKQSVGASIWADVSKDEFVGAIRHDLKRRILYTTLQQSQPLTDEQYLELLLRTGSKELLHYTAFVNDTLQGGGQMQLLKSAKDIRDFVEAAHGIKKGGVAAKKEN